MNIRLVFTGFWSGFNKEDNLWIWILKQKNNVVLDSVNPNLVITDNPNNDFPNAYTIYFTGESFFPEQHQINGRCDHFTSGFYLNKENHTRLPLYYLYIYEFIRIGLIPDFSFFHKEIRETPIKTNFCVYVGRTLNGKRGDFFNSLSKYKKIDTNVSPYNDISIPFDNSGFNSSKPKINFIKKYKFNIAFENNFRGNHQCFPGAELENGYLLDLNGHTGEKILEPLISGVVPIYWGNKTISQEFNPKTFLNYYDFTNEDELIEKIIELDNNDDLYNSYFNHPISSKEQKPVLNLDYLVGLFENIIKNIY